MASQSPFKKILDFIIYSNLFIAAGVACFTLQTALIFPIHTQRIEEFSILNFITTFVLYNLQRLYYASHENVNAKYNWYTANRRLIFTLMVLLVMCFFARLLDFFLQHPDYFLGYLLLAVLSVFYFLPPLQLRKYGVLKPFIIAFVFVCTAILLPLYNELTPELWIYATGQFCFIAALCLLFDVKDLQNDLEIRLLSFPVKFGLTSTKYLTLFFLALYAGSAVFTNNLTVVLSYLAVIIPGFLFTLFLKPDRHVYFYFFLIDGLILLQYFVLQYLIGIM